MLNKYSKMYNSDLGAAITRRGREYISHCALTSEGVLYGYFPKRYDALVYTIEQIKKEDNKYLYILKNKINKKIGRESENRELPVNDKIKYMVPKVLKHLDIDEDYYMYDAIEDRLMREDFDTLIKIYYKNNVKEFLAIPKVKSLFRDSIKSMNKTKKRISKIKDVEDGFLILEDGFETELKEGVKYTVSDLEDLSETELNVYNSMEVDGNKISLENLEVNEDLIGQYLIDESSVFINPYEPPEDIIGNIDTISSMVKNVLFGNYWYGGDYIQEKDLRTDNQQETIKNINRMAIMLIDTDSNILSIEDVNKMLEDYFGDLFSNFNDDEKWFTLSNLSTIIAITSIDHGLERYKEHMNIPDEFKPRMNMKNEYLYKRFLLTSRKKNYVGAVKLKEGGVFKNAGLDVKGLSFTKSNFNKELSDKVEELVDEIMMSDEISVKHILSELRGVDEKIRAELSSDEALKYFDVKKVSDDPENLPIHDYRVNAVKLWNKIGNGEEIELPAAFHLAHIDLTNTNKMKKKYPENFMDITEFLIDRMRRDNLHKLEELRADIKEDYETIDLKDVIEVTEKEEKGLFFKGYTEIENGDVHLIISEDDDLQSDDNQYIFSKFENKFRRHYGYNKTKEIVEKMDKNIMMFNDGEYTIIKISPMFDKDSKRMEMDVYEIYENTYRLVLNEFMGRKGEEMIEYIKENNRGKIKSKWENKLGRLSANKKKYRDLSKLALPLDAQNIPQFILDFVDKIPFLSLAPNLLSPVSSGLSLETYRDGNKRQHISNVISYY